MYGALAHVPLLKFLTRISLTVQIWKTTKENYSFIHPFWRLIHVNMFYIFVYLARNTRKLTQTDLNSLETKKSRVYGQTKNSWCAPLALFPGDATGYDHTTSQIKGIALHKSFKPMQKRSSYV